MNFYKRCISLVEIDELTVNADFVLFKVDKFHSI
jgi:hypothetical protein